MNKTAIRRRRPKNRASGFTLVEMLVSVALVLLMMSMFASVFVMSTESLSKQRGIAENDQRGRLVTTTLRGDLDERTFRDVLPFRANEDTRQLGHSLSRRAGYFEIDEGNPSDDTDDVLQFTASINIRLQSKDGNPFSGRASPLSAVSNYTVNKNVITLPGNYYLSRIAINSRVWIAAAPDSSGVIYNVPYFVQSVVLSNGNTDVTLDSNVGQPGPVYLSQFEPEFDDGVFGNFKSVSSLAEVCYFLRNGILYRRVLLIRDTPTGGDAQPTYSTGVPILWNGSVENYPINASSPTFWHDFDYSAFYFTGKSTQNGTVAPGVRFHNAAESLSNSSQSPQVIYNETVSGTQISTRSFPLSLGIPNLRFGHSFNNGLPQDASSTATLNGNTVSIGRFNLQECASPAFGYPGYIPIDPVNNSNGNVSPFDRQNVVVNPTTGLVNEYTSTSTDRRGEDILLSNVLSFDVKVWDAINGQFVDIGDTTLGGPFNANVGVQLDSSGNIIGGRLNSTFGSNGHFRFDTWHPNASITTSNGAVGTHFYNEPPYYGVSPVPSPPYTYNEPPYVPVAKNAITGQLQAVPLTAIQITINYRDISSSQIRQVSIVQSLVDRVKQTSVTNEAPEE